MPSQGGERGDGAIRLVARMAGRAPQVVRLVDHQQVDPGGGRLLGEAAAGNEGLQADDGAAVDLERVEVRPVVGRHVVQPLRVEQDEDLVVLPPQLAEPLQGQRLGDHHQRAVGAAGVEEAVHDQAGLDRLAEADLVGQQPAHRVAVAGALGGVELVGEELDAAAQERAEPSGLADPQEPEAVEPVDEVLEGIDLAAGQPLQGRRLDRQRPQLVERDVPTVGQGAAARVAGLDDHDLLARREAGAAPGSEGEPHESVRRDGEAQDLIRVGKTHEEVAPADLQDLAGAELGIVTVGQAVAGLPHRSGDCTGGERRMKDQSAVSCSSTTAYNRSFPSCAYDARRSSQAGSASRKPWTAAGSASDSAYRP